MNGWWIPVLIYLAGLLIGAVGTLASATYLESEHSQQDGAGSFASLGIMVWPILLVIDIGIILTDFGKKKLKTGKSQKTNEEYQAL